MNALPIALLPCWICLLAAGCLVRSANRDEWRQEWLSELWCRWHALSSRNEWSAWSAIQFYRSAGGCFRDACQFASCEDRWISVRAQMRTPRFCTALLAAGLVSVALCSGGFEVTRIILPSLANRSNSRVALVSRTGRLQAIRTGIPRDLANLWLHDSKLLEAMAMCSFAHPQDIRIGNQIFRTTSVRASRNLLNVVAPPIMPQARKYIDTSKPAALISFSFWRHELHGDPKVLGKWLKIGNRGAFITGVLPARVWFISPSIQIYELGARAINEQGILVIRAKPDVSAAQLEAELSHTADQNDMPFTQTAPHVLFLADALHTPLWFFASSLVIAVILLCAGYGARLRRGDRAEAILPIRKGRWWLFLFAKTSLALLAVFIAGLEFLVGLSHQLITEPLGGPVLLWFYIAGCTAVLFAVTADQQSRCRVCLQCLAFPIRVGCPGCLFLDWSGTELLCPDGHGILYIPHHLACWDEADRWVALEI